MSLRKGDHLIIQRDGEILGPDDEAYHEFEVMDYPSYQPAPQSKHLPKTRLLVELEVVA